MRALRVWKRLLGLRRAVIEDVEFDGPAKTARRLVIQLERLGHSVTLQEASAA